MTLAQLNRLDDAGFTAAVGSVFENSPWIARAAAERRPFSSVEALYDALVRVLRDADVDRQTALIAAHPDLAGRLTREGRLTPASAAEQASAGLAVLSADERSRFDELNAAYRARFGFPFVICAREQTKTSILHALEERLKHSREHEIATALREIEAIARLRLLDAVSEN
ncbi:MAG: 2-oxo-4-hydroxy-4-carboxy-5-ureidoimidazoline decarboxylase [Candidatus Aquilonibacter sp.]|jgi:2-oxo-4-hydroxy-4-carboxy-5-ureidoimidazoline decarboxylase